MYIFDFYVESSKAWYLKSSGLHSQHYRWVTSLASFIHHITNTGHTTQHTPASRPLNQSSLYIYIQHGPQHNTQLQHNENSFETAEAGTVFVKVCPRLGAIRMFQSQAESLRVIAATETLRWVYLYMCVEWYKQGEGDE